MARELRQGWGQEAAAEREKVRTMELYKEREQDVNVQKLDRGAARVDTGD